MNRSAVLRSALPRLVALAVLAVGAVLVYRDRQQLQEAVATIGVGPALLSLLCALLGTLCVEQIWLSVLVGLGGVVPAGEALQVFLVSQLGKYLPGSVWPVLAQMEFGRRRRIPRSNMLAANVLMLTVVTATGLLTASALLPWSSADGLRSYWWTLLLIPPLVALLHPRAVPAVLDRLMRVARRAPLGASVAPSGMVKAVCWGFATWLLLGLHLLVMVHALGGQGATAVAASIGGMALAFSAGLVIIPAPAGAGIREAVLVGTFGSVIGTSDGLAVALASRVLLVVADVALAGGAGLMGRRRPVPTQAEAADPTADSSEV